MTGTLAPDHVGVVEQETGAAPNPAPGTDAAAHPGGRRRIGAFALFAAPFLLVSAVMDLLFTLRSTTNIVFADTWSFVPMMGQALNGHVTPAAFWDAHNENRQPFLRAMYLLSARFDHLNVTHLRIVGIAILLVMEALLLLGAFMLRQPFLRIIVAIGITLLTSCVGQWESMFLEENSMFFLTVAGAAASFWLMERVLRTDIRERLVWRVLPVVACGLVASLSLAAGLAVWPTLAARAATYRRTRGNAVLGGSMAAVGLLVFAAYSWHMPGGGLSQGSWWHQSPLTLVRFFLLCAGSSTFNVGASSAREVAGYGIGALLLIGFGWSLWNAARSRSAWWNPVYGAGISLQIFGLFQVAFIEYGRIGMGLDLALGSRYTTLTQTLPIGLLLCLGSEADRRWVRSERREMGRFPAAVARVGVWACVPLLAVGVSLTDVNQFDHVSGYHSFFTTLQQEMRMPRGVSDAQLAGFEWPPGEIRQAEVILRHFDLNAYQR